MTLRRALAQGLAALPLDLDATAQEKLLAYVALLEKWNRTHSLTAIRAPERMVTHHLLDALAVLPHLPQDRGLRLIDVGSGGGLPGIPLALARPDWNMTLLDSNRKKAAFLRQAAVELALANVTVEATRVEAFIPARPFDVAISRAFAELSRFVALARHTVRAGGQMIALKGSYPEGELAQLPKEVRLIAAPALRVPGVDAERHLVVLKTGGAPA